MLKNFCFDFRAYLTVIFIVLCAGFGGDGESLWNRKTKNGHLSEVCAFTAEQFTHFCIAFRKGIDKLFHNNNLLKGKEDQFSTGKDGICICFQNCAKR